MTINIEGYIYMYLFNIVCFSDRKKIVWKLGLLGTFFLEKNEREVKPVEEIESDVEWVE